jgi:transporter family-2 protein
VELSLLILTLLAGAGLPVQASVNATLARHVGRADTAAFVNFAVGTVALVGWLAARNVAIPAAGTLVRAPLWAWTGGLLGAFYVSVITHVAPRLGVVVTLALSMAGMMLASLALDATGALGMAVRPLTGARVLGGALLVVGVLLVRR